MPGAVLGRWRRAVRRLLSPRQRASDRTGSADVGHFGAAPTEVHGTDRMVRRLQHRPPQPRLAKSEGRLRRSLWCQANGHACSSERSRHEDRSYTHEGMRGTSKDAPFLRASGRSAQNVRQRSRSFDRSEPKGAARGAVTPRRTGVRACEPGRAPRWLPRRCRACSARARRRPRRARAALA